MKSNLNNFQFRVLAEVQGCKAPIVVSRTKSKSAALRALKKYTTAIVQSVYDNSVVSAKYQGFEVPV